MSQVGRAGSLQTEERMAALSTNEKQRLLGTILVAHTMDTDGTFVGFSYVTRERTASTSGCEMGRLAIARAESAEEWIRADTQTCTVLFSPSLSFFLQDLVPFK